MEDQRAPRSHAAAGRAGWLRTAAAPPSTVATLIYWALPVVWMAVIFYGSSRGPTGLSTSTSWMAHMVQYGILTFLLVLASAKTTRLDWRILIVAVSLAAVLYAGSDELHQALVPGRTASLLDWVTDTFGVLGVTLSMNQRFFKRPPGIGA